MSHDKFPQSNSIFLAMFIDLIVVNIIGISIVKIYAAIASNFLDKYTLSYIGFALYCICLLYVPVLSALCQTVGQKITKIKIVKTDGSQPKVSTAILRWFLSIFSLFGYNQSTIPWFDRKLGLKLISIKE